MSRRRFRKSWRTPARNSPQSRPYCERPKVCTASACGTCAGSKRDRFRADDMLLYYPYLERLKQDIELHMKRVAAAERNVAQKRQALLEAVKKRKILDKLKEKQLQAHLTAEVGRERRFADESAAQQHARRLTAATRRALPSVFFSGISDDFVKSWWWRAAPSDVERNPPAPFSKGGGTAKSSCSPFSKGKETPDFLTPPLAKGVGGI